MLRAFRRDPLVTCSSADADKLLRKMIVNTKKYLPEVGKNKPESVKRIDIASKTPDTRNFYSFFLMCCHMSQDGIWRRKKLIKLTVKL